MQHASERETLRRGMLPARLRAFMKRESSGGLVMLSCAALALIVANSPLAAVYHDAIHSPLSLGFRGVNFTASLTHWMQDVGMVFFFLLIGLELKRERCEGFLSQRNQIILPLCAAAGGMAVPALVFFFFNHHSPATLRGWAIPSATDIAFALAMLTVAGGKILPPSVKIFLLAIAIFDDLGAILVIASFYSTGLHPMPLLLAVGACAGLALLNRAHITHVTPYLLLGAGLWGCFYHGGVHTTLAGVLVGLAIPMRDPNNSSYSPVNASMHFLHPWVSFLIVPAFAFTHAGLSLDGLSLASLYHPLPLGIALGLFLGKQVGIFGTTWLLVRFCAARMPEGARWRDVYAMAVLSGIGFTMSLFIGTLAFDAPATQVLVTLGVLVGSLLCVLWAAVVLRVWVRA